MEEVELEKSKEKEEEKKGEKKKKKPKRGLFERSFNSERLKKNSKVAVVYLMNNRLADFKEMEAINGEFVINGNKYHTDRDCIYATKKNRIPMAIIREWDLIPLGTKQWEDEGVRKQFAQLERHVLQGIKNAELYKVSGQGNVNPNLKKYILMGIAAIVGIAVLVSLLN